MVGAEVSFGAGREDGRAAFAALDALRLGQRYEEGREAVLDSGFETSVRSAAARLSPSETHGKLTALACSEQLTVRRMLQDSLDRSGDKTSIGTDASFVRGAIDQLKLVDREPASPQVLAKKEARLQDLLLGAIKLFEAEHNEKLADGSKEIAKLARTLIAPNASGALSQVAAFEHAAKCEMLSYIAKDPALRESTQNFIVAKLVANSTHGKADRKGNVAAAMIGEAPMVLDQLLNQLVADSDPRKSTNLSLTAENVLQELKTLGVGRALSIGRHGLCDLVVNHTETSVSRIHSILVRTASGWGLLQVGQSPVNVFNPPAHMGDVQQGQWIGFSAGSRLTLYPGFKITLP